MLGILQIPPAHVRNSSRARPVRLKRSIHGQILPHLLADSLSSFQRSSVTSGLVQGTFCGHGSAAVRSASRRPTEILVGLRPRSDVTDRGPEMTTRRSTSYPCENETVSGLRCVTPARKRGNESGDESDLLNHITATASARSFPPPSSFSTFFPPFGSNLLLYFLFCAFTPPPAQAQTSISRQTEERHRTR